jgi:hypothetical protein
MPSVPRRTALAAAASVVALACLVASAAAAKTTTKYGDEFHAKTDGCRASRDMHKHDVVIRCGKGKVGQVDWSFRMRDSAGAQNVSAKVCTYGGSCKPVAGWQLQRVVTVGGKHLLLVKVPFVGRSPDITKVVATVT